MEDTKTTQNNTEMCLFMYAYLTTLSVDEATMSNDSVTSE